MSANVRTWIGGTVVVCLVIIALGWLLVISPQRATASDAREQAANVKVENDTLAVQVAKLKKQFEQMASYEGKLASARKAMPSDAAIADLLRQIDTLASNANLVVVSVAPAEASGPTEPEKEAPKPSASASPSAAPTAKATPAAVPATKIVQLPDGLQAIPLTIDVVGGYADTLKFVSGLQTKLGRYVLVDSITQTALAEGEAASGRPSTKEGDIESAIGGVVYLLPSGIPTPAPTTEPKMPTAPKDRNVFAPPPAAKTANTTK